MPSVEITKAMNVTDFQEQVSRLGKSVVVPHAKKGVNAQGEEVLFLRTPNLKDRIKDLLMSKEGKRNADLLVEWLNGACQRSGMNPDFEPVKDVKTSLERRDGSFQSSLEHLVSAERLGNPVKRRKSLGL